MQHSLRKQKGAALFVSLIFLLILTVLGVTSMNDTIMQGKMASAIQDGNVAFQGAETAVRLAEEAIEGFVTTGEFDNSKHLYSEGFAPDPFAAATWTGDSSEPTSAVTGQADAPRYFIELAGLMKPEDDDGVNVVGGEYLDSGGEVFAFRIVARGTGGTSKSQRVIETYYGKILE
jgi:type IV pilus assembly protein PilX